MKTDRDLLLLAAKAAGMVLDYTIRPDGLAFYHSDRNALALADGGWFAPLDDDGDAFRLQVKLRMEVYEGAGDGPEAWVGIYVPRNPRQKFFCEVIGNDPCAAFRRAIVRASASIGESLKDPGRE